MYPYVFLFNQHINIYILIKESKRKKRRKLLKFYETMIKIGNFCKKLNDVFFPAHAIETERVNEKKN